MIIGDKVKVTHVINTRPDFDMACRTAYDLALGKFRISVDGHSDKVDFVRSTDNIHVKFLSYEHIGFIGGHEHLYKFEAWIEREE